MSEELSARRVEVSLVGAPPTHRIELCQGVSQVEVDGSVVTWIVWGSFQPLLEALQGHEVISLTSSPIDP